MPLLAAVFGFTALFIPPADAPRTLGFRLFALMMLAWAVQWSRIPDELKFIAFVIILVVGMIVSSLLGRSGLLFALVR